MAKHRRNNKNNGGNRDIILSVLGTVVVAWLVALTIGVCMMWKQHMWQAESHSNSIYELMVENGKQQADIDKLIGNE